MAPRQGPAATSGQLPPGFSGRGSLRCFTGSSPSSPAPPLSATWLRETQGDDCCEAQAILPHPQCGRPSPTNTTATSNTNTTITCSTFTTYTIDTIDTIATTTYTASTFTTTRSSPGLAQNSDSGLGGGGAPICSTLTACSTYTIVTIATTTYNASIFTTTPRPPLTANS